MPEKYDKFGIRFLYPENWQLTDEKTGEWPRTVTVESPAGGFWSLAVYNDADPETLTKGSLELMRGEYEGLESNKLTDRFDEFELSGYEMFFCCLDFVVQARVLSLRVAGQTFLLEWQAEDREFEKQETVFRAITISLFSHISAALREAVEERVD